MTNEINLKFIYNQTAETPLILADAAPRGNLTVLQEVLEEPILMSKIFGLVYVLLGTANEYNPLPSFGFNSSEVGKLLSQSASVVLIWDTLGQVIKLTAKVLNMPQYSKGAFMDFGPDIVKIMSKLAEWFVALSKTPAFDPHSRVLVYLQCTKHGFGLIADVLAMKKNYTHYRGLEPKSPKDDGKKTALLAAGIAAFASSIMNAVCLRGLQTSPYSQKVQLGMGTAICVTKSVQIYYEAQFKKLEQEEGRRALLRIAPGLRAKLANTG